MQMIPYLVELEFNCSSTLVDGLEQISIKDWNPDRNFIVRRAPGALGDAGWHRVRVVVTESNRRFAENAAKTFVRKFVSLIALVTSSHCGSLRCSRITDWSDGLEMREDFVYKYSPGQLPLEQCLDQEIATSVGDLLQREHHPAVWNALDWFNIGLEARSISVRFKSFWLCLETLIEAIDPSEKVSDVCVRCRNALYCETCGTYPKHWPFPKQKIQQLLSEIVPNDPGLFAEAEDARNRTFHGGAFVVDGFDAGGVVDRLGKAALACLWAVIALSTGDFELEVTQRLSYTDMSFRAEMHFSRALPLYEGRPNPADLPEVNAWIELVGHSLKLVGPDVPQSGASEVG